MTWKCPSCGTQNKDDRSICLACGYVRASRVTLTAATTGMSVAMAIDTSFGKAALRPLNDPDVVYASEPQFHIFRDPANGEWRVLHDDAAKNPTYIDGRQITSRSLLRAGSILTIGPSKMKLKVAIEWI